MSDDWRIFSLREVARFRGGFGFPDEYQGQSDGDLPFFKVSDMSRSENARFLISAANYVSRRVAESSGWRPIPAGSVAFAKVGAALLLNRRRQLGQTSLVDNNMLALTPKSTVSNEWLYWQLQTVDFADFVQTGALPSINQRQLGELRVPVPTLREQQQVSHILDTLNTQIGRTEEVIAKLEQIKQGLLTDLLTRGIDENGGLRPSPEEAPGLYKNSPVGRIPREWDLRTVVDEFQIQAGFTLGAHRIPNAYPCPYLRVGNVFRGRLELDDIAYLEARPAELSNRALRQGDLLVVEGHANPNEIGRCAMVTEEADGFTFQNHLFRLRPLNLTANFALLWMNSEYIQSYWRANCATSSGLYTINRTKLGAVPVIVPSKKEQVRIGSLMEQFERRRSSERNKLDKLWTLRKGLTDDLLTGRVRVPPLLEEADQAAV